MFHFIVETNILKLCFMSLILRNSVEEQNS